VDEFVWTQLPKRPATWTQSITRACGEGENRTPFNLSTLDDDAGTIGTVHFINVTSNDIASIAGHVPELKVGTCDQTPSWTVVPISRPPSMLDSILEGFDQGSVLLLDYCTFTGLNTME